MSEKLKKDLFSSIRDIPDYPKPGILFKDITTLINHSVLFSSLIDTLKERYEPLDINFVAGIESRGFIFGAALAYALKVGFVPIRKKGKLPFTTVSEKYSLEYGFDEIEMHIDAFRNIKEARVILIDDLIATGGTAQAAVRLIESVGAKCVEACFILDLPELGGSEKLREFIQVFTILDAGLENGH
ncbi:adenine phosphoribosyltransferase [Helicobacter sp. 12S02232-10]|uniref:adenine phosphoribosyltransferase n=1 Tax=Helicobacter sp. 12S02232-10 TaxID=1476197 RepID=UPI000BD3A7AC|nr:adenine phosphoribosyltransferase [Helicobacter sp. 12S02232-10]PAF49268.1 adenine phosphoribosyltransferase [Helicobacter sp. 12S02232-10]